MFKYTANSQTKEAVISRMKELITGESSISGVTLRSIPS